MIHYLCSFRYVTFAKHNLDTITATGSPHPCLHTLKLLLKSIFLYKIKYSPISPYILNLPSKRQIEKEP